MLKTLNIRVKFEVPMTLVWFFSSTNFSKHLKRLEILPLSRFTEKKTFITCFVTFSQIQKPALRLINILF